MRILRGDRREIDRKKGAIWSVRSDVCREREKRKSFDNTRLFCTKPSYHINVKIYIIYV